MLKFKVNNQFLYIKKGTSIQLEYNNSIFDTEKIEGDIIYTFDVPAIINDVIFKNAKHLYVKSTQKYECIIYVGSIEIANASLYIQHITKETYSLGVVINPYPENWGDKKLSENYYADDLIISHSYETHRQEFLQFLQNTLASDSLIKFPLFLDEEFYGNGNEDFGFFISSQDDLTDSSPAGIQASIHSENSTKLDSKYVNRLFTYENGTLIEELSTGNRGVRIFNRTDMANGNSFAFAPAIQFLWILEKVINSAGYSLIGNFKTDRNIKKIIHQSLRALDANNDPSNYLEAIVLPQISTLSEDHDYAFNFFDENQGRTINLFQAPTQQSYTLKIKIRFILTDPLEATITQGGTYNDDVVALYLLEDGQYGYIPDEINQADLITRNWDKSYWITNYDSLIHDSKPTVYAIIGKYMLNTDIHLPNTDYKLRAIGNNIYELTAEFRNVILGSGKKYYFYLMRTTLHCSTSGGIQQGYYEDGVFNLYEYNNLRDFSVLPELVVNTFANKIVYSEHVPSLTNREFLCNICNLFGLNYFIDSNTKQIELSFFKDLSNAKHIDISEYLLTNETDIEIKEDKNYSFVLGSYTEEDISIKDKCDEVINKYPMPPAKDSNGKICFIKNLNKFQIAEKKDNAPNYQFFWWVDYAGNVKKLQIGSGENTEEISPTVKIPYLISSWNNAMRRDTHIVTKINKTGISKVFDTGESEQDLILLNYHGRQKLLRSLRNMPNNIIEYEFASPVCWDKGGHILSGINLTATGENSVGEKYVKPVLEMLSKYKKVNMKFLFPIHVFLDMIKLIKPQLETPSDQSRFVMVNNIKFSPIKMKFEFTQGRTEVLSEIQFAQIK